MRFVVPFLFVFGCWTSKTKTVTVVVYKTKTVNELSLRPVACRLCVDKDDSVCLPRLPIFEWNKTEEEVMDMKETVISWVDYASICLGVDNNDVRQIIYYDSP